jgi:DMSO/TMAO reductase YedYZ molybdopterin-dependent catalytic subunit
MTDPTHTDPDPAPDRASADAAGAPAVSDARAALAGVAAAGAALGTGELVTSVAGTGQSLVASVGTAFIDRFAGPLKDPAVEIFGTGDKAALLTGIVVTSLLIGAAVGLMSRRWPWAGPAVFAGFGVVGLLAGIADAQASPGLAVVASVLAALAGTVALAVLLGVAATGQAPRPAELLTSSVTEHPTTPAATRRAFVGSLGAAGGMALVAGGAARLLTGRTRAEVARSSVRLPPVAGEAVPGEPAPLGVPGLSPYYVPNEDFYLIDTALVKPQVDPATWKLRVTGLVDNPFELSFDELLAMPQVEEAVTLSCVSNEVGGDLVGNARWQGVRLADVLDRAGVRPEATQIVGVSTDGWTAGFPTSVGLDGRVAMIAVGMNGEPLPIAHGFPARLVVSGLYGYVSATKWLEEIRLTTLEGFDGYWIDKGWAKQAPVKTQSRIDVPNDFATITAGPTKVAGVAWAPNTGITRVEVQVDGGAWQQARLAEVVSDNTWVQWVLDWDAPPGEHELRCRATDATGATQTEQRTRPDPDGATGWHRIGITVQA